MALFDDVSEGMKKILLAGVGAVAMGAEKAPELLDDLVKKGEEALEQGKTLNDELTRKVKETASDVSDEVLRSRFRGMTAEERAAWIANAQKISEDLEAEDAEVEETEVPAEDAEVEEAEVPAEDVTPEEEPVAEEVEDAAYEVDAEACEEPEAE